VRHRFPRLLSAARANAFDIRIRQVEFAQQGFKVALSKNERFPAISVGPFYSMENAIDREQRAGLGVSLPLPLWDRNVGNIATSKARQQQAEASLAMTQREVERRVAQNAAILTAKRAEIDNLKGDELAKFREAAETADRNYQLGAVPLTIYVETQKQYLELVGALAELQKDGATGRARVGDPDRAQALRRRGAAMIDKILEFSVRQRVLVLMGALALLLGGLWSATKLPDGRHSRHHLECKCK
jgi:outer membrane protein TolC